MTYVHVFTFYKTTRKRDFAEILKNVLIAGDIKYLQTFPAAAHIGRAFKQVRAYSRCRGLKRLVRLIDTFQCRFHLISTDKILVALNIMKHPKID